MFFRQPENRLKRVAGKLPTLRLLKNYLNGFFDLRISILFEIFLVKNSNIFLYFSAPGERYISKKILVKNILLW